MISPDEALHRLQEGNRRFTENALVHSVFSDPSRRSELVAGQAPFAIILGCSDSRVPAEIVFDHGPGDLFVIRVAGNIVAPSQIGSVEFAAEQFGTPLVVVLGHSNCGAVEATLDQLSRATGGRSPHLHAIVDRIAPAVESLVGAWEAAGANRETVMEQAVRANILASAEKLRTRSDLLRDRIERGALRVIGAEYSLRAGTVQFLDEAADTPQGCS